MIDEHVTRIAALLDQAREEAQNPQLHYIRPGVVEVVRNPQAAIESQLYFIRATVGFEVRLALQNL